MLRTIICSAVFATLVAGLCSATSAPLFDWARYKLTPCSPDEQLTVREITILMGPRENGLQWWELSGAKSDGSTYAVRTLSERVPMVGNDEGIGRVERYLFRDGDRPWLEYRDKSTNGPLLPKFDFHEHLLPRPAVGSATHGAFVEAGEYLGHALALEETGCEMFDSHFSPLTLVLDPTLIIGTARTHRTTNEQRPENRIYDYRDLNPSDYRELIEAGFNFFLVGWDGPWREGYFRERPVFYGKYPEKGDFPSILYRSNYTGCVMFNDEPAVLVDFNPCPQPHDAADKLRADVKEELAGDGYYGSRLISKRFGDSGSCLGKWDLFDRDIPSWDAVCESAYYQVEAGASGMIHEGMYNLTPYNNDLKRVISPEIEVNVEELLKLHYGFMRGAARCFDRDWGTSIYGQADPKLSPMAVEMAYDMGARYIWYWTGGGDFSEPNWYHLPFHEQVELTRLIRERRKTHPRPPMAQLLRAADAIVVFPEGYTYFGSSGLVWHSGSMPEDAPNDAGFPHRFVMGRAMWEAVKLMRQGSSVDFAVEGEPVRRAGYNRLVTVGLDGSVKEERSPDVPSRVSTTMTLTSSLPNPKMPATAPLAEARFVRAGSLEIDGDLSDWRDAEWLELSSPQDYVIAEEGRESEISARVAFGYDRESFYVAAEVRDEEHHHKDRAWGLWKGDSILIALDPNLDRTEGGFLNDDIEFGIGLSRDGIDSYKWQGRMASFAGPLKSADIEVKRSGETTLYEARIPLTELVPLRPGLQTACGLNVVVNQADESGLIGYLAWTPGTGETKHHDPSEFGILRFRDAVESLDRPMARLADTIAVVEPGSPVRLEVHSASAQATPVLVNAVLTSGGRTVRSETAVEIPPGRAEFEWTIPDGLPSGGFTGEVRLTTNSGEAVGQSKILMLVW